jgi:hypothetical protein
MKPFRPVISPLMSASYAVCRHAGAPRELAAVELALSPDAAEHLERLFRGRSGGGADPMKPGFARHAAHVRAVLAVGGFPVLPEAQR